MRLKGKKKNQVPLHFKYVKVRDSDCTWEGFRFNPALISFTSPGTFFTTVTGFFKNVAANSLDAIVGVNSRGFSGCGGCSTHDIAGAEELDPGRPRPRPGMEKNFPALKSKLARSNVGPRTRCSSCLLVTRLPCGLERNKTKLIYFKNGLIIQPT